MDTHGHDCKVLFVVYTLAHVLLCFIMYHYVNLIQYSKTFIHCHHYHYCVVPSS